MTRLIILTFIVSLSVLSCSKTKQDKDKDRINVECDKIMQNFCDRKYPEAIQILRLNTIISSSDLDSLQVKTINQMNSYPAYGKALSYDFVIERSIKDYIARRFYVLKFENYYLKFDFTLYKSSTGWSITGFNYNEELLELLN